MLRGNKFHVKIKGYLQCIVRKERLCQFKYKFPSDYKNHVHMIQLFGTLFTLSRYGPAVIFKRRILLQF
jgi:hypothetical protein